MGRIIVKGRKALAFTMAEILISLTIIGIIAAITLPSLIENINEKSWATQRKALYSRMSQAIALMPSLNGYGVGENNTQTAQNAALTFVTNGLSKVLKINNICNKDNFQKCGIPAKYKTIGNTSNKNFPTTMRNLNFYMAFNLSASYNAWLHDSYSVVGTDAAAFETANGESVAVYYQPYCIPYADKTSNSFIYYTQPFICANFVYDLNGRKGPNKVGKDIGFMTALYAIDPVVVAPYPMNNDLDYTDASTNFDNTEAKKACRAAGDYRLPNLEEAASIFANETLLNLSADAGTSYYTSRNGVVFNPVFGEIATFGLGGSKRVRCVQK